MPSEDMGDMVTVELFFQCRHDVVSEEIRVPRADWDAMSAGQRDAYLADRVDALVCANSSAGWREIQEG
ncbi:hypothetical protein [Microbispora sp. KK1-11]|uniref:DUF7167 family protein n=1 Tax=Microbispora sp. KK1-11 TaxID=2053005 RepID=UPI00115BB6E2|nr:hypothetical protein [Microbispora sp. KK1-11]TQS24957.1 hypothetical protein FLW16_33505 [Microbispora sp. KK1-11]